MPRERASAILRRLERLAQDAGAPVRYEVMPTGERDGPLGRGGLVSVFGRRQILCSQSLPDIDKIAVLAEALSELGIECLHLPKILALRLRRRPRVVFIGRLPSP